MKINPYLNNYSKTIICDIDDTISSTTTHDWEFAQPIYPTINKINKLYDMGWTIILMTARGQVSCQGDFKKADEKYRTKIEQWLKKNGVKYHMLSFEKYLGAYYVDDKSILPEEFSELDIREIKTGLSGAIVEKRGDRIYKTHKDSLNSAKWYEMAAPLINVPIVYNVIGDTIALEYLKDNGKKIKISDVIEIIETFSMYASYIPFSVYIDRIKSHCTFNDNYFHILDILKKNESYFDSHRSFCHGDLSLENMIQTDRGLYLIDPIWEHLNFSSYLLDIAKLLHSYRKYNRMFEYEVFLGKWVKRGLDRKMLILLEITQWIRVVKYLQTEEDKKFFNDTIEHLFNTYYNLCLTE